MEREKVGDARGINQILIIKVYSMKQEGTLSAESVHGGGNSAGLKKKEVV